MILSILKERAGMFVFGIAALAAPVATFVPSSCGAACGGCPLAGGCIIVPAVAVGIGAFSIRSRARALFSRITGKPN